MAETCSAIESRALSVNPAGSSARRAAMSSKATPRGQVGERVVGRGLVGDDVDGRVVLEQLREDVGGVAEQADRQGSLLSRASVALLIASFDVLGLLVEVAELDAAGDPGLVALDADDHAAVHGHGQRLGAAHAAQAAGQGDRAFERAAEAFGRDGGERLVGALQDALGADVDPGAGRHLAVHGQAEVLQAAELLPGRPLRDQVGVGDEHAGGPLVRSHDADGLAGLDEERLVVLEVLQGL